MSSNHAMLFGSFIMMLGKYSYYNKKMCDGDYKYGLGLMQGSVPNLDSFYFKLHQLNFPQMLTLSIYCGLF